MRVHASILWCLGPGGSGWAVAGVIGVRVCVRVCDACVCMQDCV